MTIFQKLQAATGDPRPRPRCCGEGVMGMGRRILAAPFGYVALALTLCALGFLRLANAIEACPRSNDDGLAR